MLKIKKNLIIKLFFVCLFLFFVHSNCFSYFLFNGSGEGYPGDEENSGSTIETYVTTGAGYYLRAQRAIQEFLALFEIQDMNGIDFNEWRKVIDSALNHMNGAAQTYDLLIAKAGSTPYNEVFITRLIGFDYTGFAEEKGLNTVIFKECEEYLKRGDITGMYRYTRAKFTVIIDMLHSIKVDLSANKMPDLSLPWKLNETCAELSLFGNYASRVFFAVMAE